MAERPLRFCMITTFFPPYNFGGDGIYVRRLSNELAKLGHRVDVVHCIDSYKVLARRRHTGNCEVHPNVTLRGLESPYGFLSPLATQQSGRPLLKRTRIRKILEQGFDVLHYHNISLVGGPGILHCGRGIKLYTMHEHWLLCPTHTLFRFNREVCTKPRCLACSLIYRRPPQWWRYTGLLRRSLKEVDAFLALNRHTASKHLELGALPLTVLPPFIPTADSGASAGSGDQSLRENFFLFVGRLEKLKGLQTLIPFFRKHRQFELRVVGTGDFEARLRHLAGDSQNIRFLGYQAEAELTSLYRRALGLIVPSICLEMAPQVILEAFREGTPAIVRKLGGMPELVEESGGGLVYSSDGELKQALDRLSSNSEYREEMGRRGNDTILNKWTAQAHLAGYLELIRNLQAKRRR
jgi:glycosyltransferase involved in cell wall biosynthesis